MGLFSVLVFIALLLRFGRIIYKVVMKITPEEPSEISGPLFVKKGTTGAEYLEIASNAMIYENKNLTEVKQLLRNKGMYEEGDIELYAEKAKQRYDKWLSENDNQPQSTVFQQYDRMYKQTVSIDPAIKLSSIAEEDHARHFSALIGKRRYFTNSGREILYAMVNAALTTDPVIQNDTISIRQLTFKGAGGAESNPHLRVVVAKGQQEAVFPYLKTDLVVSFQTNEIIEWENGDALEAEIRGVAQNGFNLGFFASDYAVNKSIYQTQPKLDVRISGFALIIDDFVDENSILSLNKQMGYFNTAKHDRISYFNFAGKILTIKAAPISSHNLGCIMTLELIQNKEQLDILIVDVFVNNENIIAAEIKKEMFVTGTLWLQGELAD